MQPLKTLKTTLKLLPLFEIAGFIVVGKLIGVMPTLLLIIATTMLGLFILRVQGFTALAEMQRRVASGYYPSDDGSSNGLLLLGGLFLLLPGFITDCIGLLLLLPFIRRSISSWLINHATLQPSNEPTQQEPYHQTDVIEGEFHRDDE